MTETWFKFRISALILCRKERKKEREEKLSFYDDSFLPLHGFI
jgi:hypothetical protein